MSSSAPKRQPDCEAEPFAYADVRVSSGPATEKWEGSHPDQERSERQRAECLEQGRRAAEQQLRAEVDAALAKHREEVGRVLLEFAAERQNYYRRVEGEVVQLALAIARKILHREVQIDPQALAGIVRVTLEKFDTATEVKLRVSPKEATDWRHYFACQMGDVPAPEVHEDPAIVPGQCRIETSLGSTDVGLELQLKEIETGLLDLLAERPGATAGQNSGQSSVQSTVQSPDARAAGASHQSEVRG